jgi:hypothetical protein
MVITENEFYQNIFCRDASLLVELFSCERKHSVEIFENRSEIFLRFGRRDKAMPYYKKYNRGEYREITHNLMREGYEVATSQY